MNLIPGVNLVGPPPKYDDVERQRQLEKNGKLLDNVKNKLLMIDHGLETMCDEDRVFPTRTSQMSQSRAQLEPPLSPISETPPDQNLELLQVSCRSFGGPR